MNADRRRRQKVKRALGEGHTMLEHVPGQWCLKCRPESSPGVTTKPVISGKAFQQLLTNQLRRSK